MKRPDLKNKSPLALVAESQGFTLIEVLVVMVILGLLAAIVVPNYFGQVDQAKINKAKADIHQFSTACDMYKLNVGSYPNSLQDLMSTSVKGGPYLKTTSKDPWGNEYQYQVTDNGNSVTITSSGGGKETITQDS